MSGNGGLLEAINSPFNPVKFLVLVVYKIDRLSRALMDFAKLVEVFDRNSVTFVSVTQSFNTTTSMGRLSAAPLQPNPSRPTPMP